MTRLARVRRTLRRVGNMAAPVTALVVLSACGGPSSNIASAVTLTARQLADSAIKGISWQFAQMPWAVNEAHDGQHLASGATYGPLVLAYSSPYLGGFMRDEDFADQEAAGMLVAIIYVETSPGPLPSPYGELHLARGLNCVHAVFQAPNWTGYITPTTPTGPNGLSECPRSYPQNTTTQLAVSPRPGFGPYPTPAEVPPVTRLTEWQIDHYAIGFRCGARWCEMGSPGFTYRAPAAEAGALTKERVIKGWHDEQRLAVVGPGGTLVPSDLVAKATPVANLQGFSAADFDAEKRVGTLWFAGPVDPVKHKKYFGVGFRQGENKVFARRLSPTSWQTRIEFAGGGERTFVTKREPHPDISVPGTMRWYWNDTDEGLWYRCGGACCEVEW